MTSDEALRHALAALSDRLRETVAREVEQTAARFVDRAAPADDEAIVRLLEAMRSIDKERSLVAILNALRASVTRESSRATILFVRGTRLVDDGAVAADGTHNKPLDLEIGGVLADTVRTGAAALGQLAPSDRSPVFGPLTEECGVIAVPITLAGDVVAILYAERSGSPSTRWSSSIEAMTRHASRCLEVVTAFQAARLAHEKLEVKSQKLEVGS